MVEQSKLFTFGVIADVQYCDTEDGKSFAGVSRLFRGAHTALERAVDEWVKPESEVKFVAQLGDLIDGICVKKE
jgi:manganese-dependent ADP-ribose/CDP-alcohol diphosphatase